MNRIAVAQELVKLAKELTSGENEDKKTSGRKKDILRFIKENEEDLRGDKFALARMKILGPKTDTVHMNVSIADLEAIARVLK